MTPERLTQGYYSETGTVLKRRDASREGQSLLLFLRQLGPRWVTAPAGNSKNRFGGGTEPLVWGEFSLYQSPSVLTLKAVEVKEDFLSLRTEPQKLLAALRVYRRAAEAAPVSFENDALLKLLWNTLLQLRENVPPFIAEFRFAWRALSLMGSAPAFDRCTGCGALIEGGATLSESGLLCPSCSHGEPRLSAGELAELAASALLPYDKLLLWAREPHKKETFTTNLKKMSPYFENMR